MVLLGALSGRYCCSSGINDKDTTHETVDNAIERSDNLDTERRGSVRAHLESAFEELAGRPPERDNPRDDDDDNDRHRGEPRGRPARESKSAADADATKRGDRSTSSAASNKSDAVFGTAALGQASDGPPTAWVAAAKNEWALSSGWSGLTGLFFNRFLGGLSRSELPLAHLTGHLRQSRLLLPARGLSYR
jgi:hypothetical protein